MIRVQHFLNLLNQEFSGTWISGKSKKKKLIQKQRFVSLLTLFQTLKSIVFTLLSLKPKRSVAWELINAFDFDFDISKVIV